MTPGLLAELGGPAALTETVADLYERLLADPEVSPYFAGVDVDRVRHHMVDFLVAVTGGPDAYAGRELAVAHEGLGITDAAFDSTVAHLLDVLEDSAVRLDLLDSVLDRLAPLRPLVVTAG